MLKAKSNLLTKIGMVLAAFVIVVPTAAATTQNNVADAKSKKVNCGNGYTCHKLTYYITPAKTKQLAKQTKKLQTPAAISNFIGLAGFGPGVVGLGFGSAVSANQVFIDAAKQGKGVEVSYINHQSVSTADSYNTNGTHKIK